MGKVCPRALHAMAPRTQSRDQKASLNMRSRVPNIFPANGYPHSKWALHDGVTKKFWLYSEHRFPRDIWVEMDPLLVFKLRFGITIGGHVTGEFLFTTDVPPLTCLVTRDLELHSKSCFAHPSGEVKNTYLSGGRPWSEEKWPFYSVQGSLGTCWGFDLPWFWSAKWSR